MPKDKDQVVTMNLR